MDWSLGIDNLIELVAAVLSLLYLYLEVKENPLLWFVGITSSALYAYVYFRSAFYADFGLMIYYVIISIYGWVYWRNGNVGEGVKEIPILRLDLKLGLKLLGFTALTYMLLLVILLYLPGYIGLSSSAFPYLDSFTVAASIIGTWMLTHKLLEQWLVWIVINVICIFMFWLKGLNYTMLLFVVYSVGSIVGYFRWLKHYKKQVE